MGFSGNPMEKEKKKLSIVEKLCLLSERHNHKYSLFLAVCGMSVLNVMERVAREEKVINRLNFSQSARIVMAC